MIFLAAVKIVVLILACWGLIWYTSKGFSSWHRAVQLLGIRAAVHGAGVMLKLRYREPFRYMRANAPGLSMTFPALLAVVVLSQYGPSLFSISLLVLVALWLGVIWPLIGLVPPVVLWLSASGYDNFRVLKKLQPILPDMVKTLINQASPSISEKYYGHYMRLLAVQRETARGVSKVAAAVGPIFMNPGGPRLESFRTRPGLWKQSVRDLIEVSPIVIIDTRFASGPVEEEVAWMLDPGRSFRAIWLGNPDGSYPALEAVPGDTGRIGLIKCNEKLLYDLVHDMTQSAETLPRRDGIDWARRMEEVTAELDGLLAKIRDKTVPSELLDRLIEEWDRKHATGLNGKALMPRVSTSLDAALELVKRHLPVSSLTIIVFTNGTAEVEIGVADHAGEFQVYVSGKEYQLIPARAALEALVKAERGMYEPRRPIESG